MDYNLYRFFQKKYTTYYARVFQYTNLKASELVHALDTTPATITNWSKRGISNQGAMKVARKFNIDVSWIMMSSGESTTHNTLNTNNSSEVGFSSIDKHNLSAHFKTVIVDLESVNALLFSIQEAIKNAHTERATKLADIAQKLTQELINESNAHLDTLITMS